MNIAMKKILSIALLAALVAAAGWSQAWTLDRQRDLFASGAVGAYAKGNVGTLTLARLANGIPVVVRKSDANRILGIKAVLLGHVSNTPLEKAGLEAVLIGNAGAALQGAPVTTVDFDFFFRRTPGTCRSSRPLPGL